MKIDTLPKKENVYFYDIDGVVGGCLAVTRGACSILVTGQMLHVLG